MKYLLTILLVVGTIALAGCGIEIDEPMANAVISIDTNVIEFSELLEASAHISYSVENTGQVPLQGYTASLVQRRLGSNSGTLLDASSINLAPAEVGTYEYDWLLEGVPSSDTDGEQYELYISVLDEESIELSESAPIVIEYSIPEIGL